MLKKITAVIVFVTFFSGSAFADLFTDTRNAAILAYPEYSKGNSGVSWEMGTRITPSLNRGSNVIQLGVGMGGQNACGKFGLLPSLQSLFSKEVLDQYVKGLAGSITSGAPMLLLCYASQTLCDLYKHYRNMANAGLALQTQQCNQLDKLAEDIGSGLRAKSEAACIREKATAGGGESPAELMDQCRNKFDMLVEPATGKYTPSYSIVDQMAKLTNMDSETKSTIKHIMGDAVVSVQTGAGNTSATANPYEQIVNGYTEAYTASLRDVVKQFQLTSKLPSAERLVDASSPDMPLHPSTLKSLAFTDDTTRQTVISQLASLYALIKTYYALESANSLLGQYEESPNLSTKVEKERIQREQRKLQSQINLMEKRIEIQSKYLAPALQALDRSVQMNTGDSTTDKDRFSYTYPMVPGKLGK